MATIARQTGRKIVVTRSEDGVSNIHQTQILLPHAGTHAVGGADPININNMGVYTKTEVNNMIARAVNNCNNSIPKGVELLANKGKASGYTPLDAAKKIPINYIPSWLISSGFSAFNFIFPGTLYAPATIVDKLYFPCDMIYIGACLNIFSAPTGDTDTTITVSKNASTDLTTNTDRTLTLASGHAFYAYQTSEDFSKRTRFITNTDYLKVVLTSVQDGSPGEFLTVTIYMKEVMPEA